MSATNADRAMQIISEQLGVDRESLRPESKLADDLSADSLDAVELTMELEEEFDINIPDDAVWNAKTVGDVVRYIEEALAE